MVKPGPLDQLLFPPQENQKKLSKNLKAEIK